MKITNILIGLLIFTNTAFSQSSAAFWLAGGEEEKITTNGLIAYYDASNVDSYDPANPGSTWNDLSGNNYHVTNYGATHSTDYGGVFYFDGVDDYMVYEGDINEDVMTFSIWTKGSNITTNCIVDIDDINLTNDLKQELLFFNGVSNDQFAIQSELSGTYEITGNSSYAINENIWYYITFTYNSGTYNLYINNVLISTTTDPSADLGAFDFFFNGYIGEFFFYDRVLTSQELTDNYNATKERYISSGPIWDGTQTSLLNDYPGAAAAYSVRALNSAYTGPLIKIRRSSDNEETDIYALANGDLDEALINSFCTGTDCYVQTCYDQSGNGNHATQNTAARQPKIWDLATGLVTENGKPAIQFNGLNNGLNLPAALISSIPVLNAARSFFVAGKKQTDNNIEVFWRFRNSLSESPIYGLAFVVSNKFSFFRRSNSNESYSMNSDSLFLAGSFLATIMGDGTTFNHFKNGVFSNSDSYTFSSPYATFNQGTLGIETDYVQYPYSGKLFETLVYPTDQTANRVGIETNINSAFQIYEANLLLDTYPGASAAYSVRKLDKDYTGFAMEIRRASDNATQNIGFVGEDLDEVAINSFCNGTTCYVRTWYDQSGNGNDAVQTLSTDQPVIYETGAVKTHNNKPAVFFSDALTTMLKTSSQIVTGDGFAAFVVTSGSGTQVNKAILSQHAGSADVGRVVFVGTNPSDNTKPYLFFNNGTSYVNTATTTAFDDTIKLLISEGDDVGNYSFTVNQTTDNFNISQTFTPLNTGLRIGALGALVSISQTYTGYISEIIVYDFPQTGRAGVAASINNYFSIY